MTTEKEQRIAARIGMGLKKRIKRAEKITGHHESALIRAALDHFFSAHSSAEEIMQAVVASRAKSS